MCDSLTQGFCSPRFELPAADVNQKEGKKVVIVCHFCGESGHKALYCHKMPADMKEAEAKQLVSLVYILEIYFKIPTT